MIRANLFITEQGARRHAAAATAGTRNSYTVERSHKINACRTADQGFVVKLFGPTGMFLGAL